VSVQRYVVMMRESKGAGLMGRETGDADGLGEIRKKELVRSCRKLGIKEDENVRTIEHKFVFLF
jgi:LmbE family N-acetylglucosaminyl deacetylase